MPAKASCEIKTRTVKQPQKNGDIYVIERQTQYDPVKKYNVVLSSRIIGKIPKGETSVVATRPKRSSREKVSVSNIPVPTVISSTMSEKFPVSMTLFTLLQTRGQARRSFPLPDIFLQQTARVFQA